MAWNRDELRGKLREYGDWLSSRNLSSNTVHSHGYYAGLFYRWLYGEYAPRGRAPRRDPSAATAKLSREDLERELSRYSGYLTDNGLISGAVHTYVQGASLFVKWLGDMSQGSASASAPPVRTPPPRPPVLSPASRGGADGWPSERAVQSMVVAWLVREGWSIDRVADTASREHGVDIVAHNGDSKLAVEVKGYPSELYTAGDRAGEARRYSPVAQARTYMGNALLSLMLMVAEMPGYQVMLGLPRVGTFSTLAPRLLPGLRQLDIKVALVSEGGNVETL